VKCVHRPARGLRLQETDIEKWINKFTLRASAQPFSDHAVNALVKITVFADYKNTQMASVTGQIV
jgi:hypothetical protein